MTGPQQHTPFAGSFPRAPIENLAHQTNPTVSCQDSFELLSVLRSSAADGFAW